MDPNRTPVQGSRPMLRRWMLTGAAAVPFLGAAATLSSVVKAELGVQVTGLALVVALLPLGVVVPAFLWLDRFEAEPKRYLGFAFLWGALIAAAVSLVLNTGSLVVLEAFYQQGRVAAAVVVAPVVEESLKGLGVLLILLFRRREFDGIVDGLVYAGVAAAGFAFAENTLYFGRALLESGTEGLVAVFVLRGIMAPFAHPLFTCFTGIGIGIAASRPAEAVRVIAPVIGLAAAIGLHAAWNLSALIGLDGFLTRYLLLQFPVFLAALWFAAWARQREGRLIGHYLSGYVAQGWLSGTEMEMLRGLPARRAARQWANHIGGHEAAVAMREFQDHGSELAFLRMRVSHGTAPIGAAAEELALLERMTWCRTVFLRPLLGPVPPVGIGRV